MIPGLKAVNYSLGKNGQPISNSLIVFCSKWFLSHNIIESTPLYIRMILKIKFFKQVIGIAEKSQETRRDCWGGNVNHKSLF